MAIFRSTDAVSGLLFIAFGTATLVAVLTTLNVGTPGEMGSGFFPLVASVLLVIVGICVTAKAMLTGAADGIEQFHWRPLLVVSASVLVSGLLLVSAGLVIAIPAAILVLALAMPNRNWPVMLIVAAAVTGFLYIVFVLGLQIRIPLLRV